ncbi:peroxide stress protein YaaA [Moritella sp. 24]|uniref:peroxide stress protein YaaA n=1 Tax=Moritella sp. 24 TaxID=2746230 RepID=UPI001BADBAB0|nr:peroxide stress protein YaaA [Moritella sp. 24]QUM78139.1 peroxide stress protein YaaA [Moritella sp. 24]
MLIVVSPAKTLDFETPPTTEQYSQADLTVHSAELIDVCRQLTPMDLSSLMKISDKLAGLNAARFTEWTADFTPENAKQAVFAFKGDVYTGLDAESFSETDMAFAQQHFRILSGLYGLLRPLDLIKAYRLEMGTKLTNGRGTNLYQFWGDIVTDKVNDTLAAQGDKVLINLASNEYFKAVQKKRLKGQVITPVFKDCKAGKYKIISFYAKKARGLMARYIIDNQLKDVAELKAFDTDGYYYCEAESTDIELVFKRDEIFK